MLKKIYILLILPVFCFAQTSEKEDIWKPFTYFKGSWQGHETGKAGIGKGDRTYEFIMKGKYFYFKNTSTFEPQSKNPKGEVHKDWAFFSYDQNRKKFIMRQFNIEGYVNQFTLDYLSDDHKKLIFVSENSENTPPGLRARLTYEVKNKDEFVELAMPGGEFSEYLKNYWKRK